MALPIIFFHYGNPEYLKYSLKQAKYFNPDSIVYLLGDKGNNRYPFVTHVPVGKYEDSAKAFTAVYKHRSPNSENYELNCFLRWFYIKAFCKEQGIEEFIYLDSDVLTFQDFTVLRPFFGDSSIANTCEWNGVPAVTYFKDQKAISDFCDFLLFAYKDKDFTVKLEQEYQRLSKNNDGISDMTLFHLYFQLHPDSTIKIDLINNELAIDVCISRADGYELEDGMKKIYWQDNLPYCKSITTGNLIRFASLHYQGEAKSIMRKHYKAGGYNIQRYLEPFELKANIRRVKKAIRNIFKNQSAL